MVGFAFDTYNAARDLESAGVERSHAEAITAVFRDGLADLASKADVIDPADLKSVTATKSDLTWAKADL